MKLFAITAGLLLSTGLAFGAADKKLSGTVKMDGSSTVFPVAEAMAEEFQKEFPRVRVTVGLSGTGGGFKKFTKGEIDLSNASRPIKDKEVTNAKKNNIQYLEIPVAYDGIAVVTSSQNKFLKKLTLAELKKIWEPGSKVKTWQDVNPKWPAEEIKLYGPGADSGTFDFFTEEVMGVARASRSDYVASEDDNVLVRGLTADENSLGYFGYAYYLENKDKLHVIDLDKNTGSAITPEFKTIQDGSYALSRPLLIYVNLEAAQKPEVAAFVRFFINNSKTLAKEVGYFPLPDDEYKKSLAKFNSALATAKQTH